MKKILARLALYLICASVPAAAQVALNIFANGTTLSNETIAANTPFSLNVDLSDANAVTSPVNLDSYDLTFMTLAGTPGSTATASSVNTVVSNQVNPAGAFFIVAQSVSHPNELSAYALSTGNDFALTTTPTALLTANFAGLAAGTYTIEFPASTGNNLQHLYDASGNVIAYTPGNFSLVVGAAPEPPVACLLLVGALVLVGLKWHRRQCIA